MRILLHAILRMDAQNCLAKCLCQMHALSVPFRSIWKLGPGLSDQRLVRTLDWRHSVHMKLSASQTQSRSRLGNLNISRIRLVSWTPVCILHCWVGPDTHSIHTAIFNPRGKTDFVTYYSEPSWTTIVCSDQLRQDQRRPLPWKHRPVVLQLIKWTSMLFNLKSYRVIWCD